MKRLFLLITLSLIFACSRPDTSVETTVEIPVEVQEIAPGEIEKYVESTGTVYAAKDETLLSEAQGYYRLAVNPETKKPFALGDRVKKDQTIVYLDNPEQENTIKIESYELNLENNKREYEKQQSLYEKGGVTLRELKTAEKDYVDSKYAYENAKIQLEKLKIKSTFNGIIVDLPYYTGGVKVASNSEIVRVMDFTTLKMEVKLPGKILGDVRENQNVKVYNYQYPDKTLSGMITQVSPALDPDSRTFIAKIDIKNPNQMLRPGMFIKAEIITAKKENTVVIPKEVIMTRRNRKTVFVVEQGYARERRIETGLENPDYIEVTNGLAKNDRLVIKGFETLINGSKVRISSEAQR